jgi:hypothetical protein
MDRRVKPGDDELGGSDSSGVREVEPLLDSLDSAIETVKPAGDTGVLAFQYPQATFHFTHVVAQAVDSASDVTQMLQHNIVGVGHGYFHSILVIS